MTDLDFRLTDYEYADGGDNLEEVAVLYDEEPIVFELEYFDIDKGDEGVAYFRAEDGVSKPKLEIDLANVANKLEGLEEISAKAAAKHLLEEYENHTEVRSVDTEKYSNDLLSDVGEGKTRSQL